MRGESQLGTTEREQSELIRARHCPLDDGEEVRHIDLVPLQLSPCLHGEGTGFRALGPLGPLGFSCEFG